MYKAKCTKLNVQNLNTRAEYAKAEYAKHAVKHFNSFYLESHIVIGSLITLPGHPQNTDLVTVLLGHPLLAEPSS